MYENNGGMVLALAGEDFALLAADTRLSKGYSILSRQTSRMWEVFPGVWLGAAGCHADATALSIALRRILDDRACSQGGKIAADSVAQALSALLYQRRGLPYYVFCVLAGMDSKGQGAVFTFDSIGSYERVAAAAVGSGQAFALPILDHSLKDAQPSSEESSEHFQEWSGDNGPTASRPARVARGLGMESAQETLARAASAASERDVRVGDCLQMVRVSMAPKLGGVLVRSERAQDIALKAH